MGTYRAHAVRRPGRWLRAAMDECPNRVVMHTDLVKLPRGSAPPSKTVGGRVRRRLVRRLLGGAVVAGVFLLLAVISWWATLPVHQFGPDTATVCGSTAAGDVKDGSVRRSTDVVRPDLVEVCLVDYPRALLPEASFTYEVRVRNVSDELLTVVPRGGKISGRGNEVPIPPGDQVVFYGHLRTERSGVANANLRILVEDDAVYTAQIRGSIPSRTGADILLVPRVAAVIGVVALGVWWLIGVIGPVSWRRRGSLDPVPPVEEAERVRGRA